MKNAAKIDLQTVLDAVLERGRKHLGPGKVATYIPALARVPADKLAIAVSCVDGREAAAGDADEAFSIQSVSKLFTLLMAMRLRDRALWKRVGREPSGNPFNSLVQLEYEKGVPRNPFINAGAHVTTDCIVSDHEDPKQAILDQIRTLSGASNIQFDLEVAASERDHGHWNAAIANFLKANGNLESPVDDVLDAYFHQCSIAMSCRDLARAGLFLANRGVDGRSGSRIATERKTRRINALMATCGLYDAVGSFAFHVGIPAKSGVGGGIIGVIPGEMTVAVWSPALDANGNSYAGVKMLEAFTNAIGRSIY
jgi:glutaminase